MTNIQRIFAIGNALEELAIEIGFVSVVSDGFSLFIHSNRVDEAEIDRFIYTIEVLLMSHGFVETEGNKVSTEYHNEELETTVSITVF